MLRDKNGLTEEEFLKNYDASKFERPSVTVDIVLFHESRVLLIRRGGHPFLGKLALPGGFVEPDETVYDAAKRELFEETHAKGIVCKQLPVFSEPNRDPRTRIITVPFLAHLTDRTQTVSAGDDATDARFWEVFAEDDGETLSVLLQSGNERERFTVRREHRDRDFPEDLRYSVVGESPLAGDHAAIFACAWDAEMAVKKQKQKNVDFLLDKCAFTGYNS